MAIAINSSNSNSSNALQVRRAPRRVRARGCNLSILSIPVPGYFVSAGDRAPRRLVHRGSPFLVGFCRNSGFTLVELTFFIVLPSRTDQTNQTKPNQTKPNQIKPNQTKPNHTQDSRRCPPKSGKMAQDGPHKAQDASKIAQAAPKIARIGCLALCRQ